MHFFIDKTKKNIYYIKPTKREVVICRKKSYIKINTLDILLLVDDLEIKSNRLLCKKKGERKMKKSFKLLLFALVLTFLTNTTVLAETRWDTMQPVKQTTSDGIKIEYQTKFEYILDCWYENYCDKIGVDAEVNVTVTIPEDYDKETIVIAPEVLQEIDEKTKAYEEEASQNKVQEQLKKLTESLEAKYIK